jgi:DNA-binding protein Fis
LEEPLVDLVRRYVYEVYLKHGRNFRQAAPVLGIDRRTVGRKVKEYKEGLKSAGKAD